VLDKLFRTNVIVKLNEIEIGVNVILYSFVDWSYYNNQQRFYPVGDLYIIYNTLYPNYMIGNCRRLFIRHSKSDIHIHRGLSTSGQRSLTYKGGSLWNSLPRNLTLFSMLVF